MNIPVHEVVKTLKALAPLENAADWDNVGLLLGDYNRPVKSLMTCLTVTPEVVDEAVRGKVDFIITHHPLFFHPVRSMHSGTADGRMLLGLAENRVAVYSAHTAFDNSETGINATLAHSLGLKDCSPLRAASEKGSQRGEGVVGVLPQKTSMRTILGQLKDATHATQLQFAGDASKKIDKIAIACGAAGNFFKDAAKARVELFITGEMRFHEVLAAQAVGVACCVAGHYATERFAMEHLANALQKVWPDLKIWAAKSEADPLAWI